MSWKEGSRQHEERPRDKNCHLAVGEQLSKLYFGDKAGEVDQEKLYFVV